MMEPLKTLQLTPDLDLSSLRRYVREAMLPAAEGWDKGEVFPIEAIRRLHELGYLSAFVPEAEGGLGATTLDMLGIAREISYASRGVACTIAGHMLATLPIFLFGSAALRAKIGSGVLNRGELGSFCFTEADAGSDILRIRTTARKVLGGYVLKGAKAFITNASYAHHFLVMARIEGAADPKRALSAFYLPRDSEGLRIGQPLSKLGFRDSNTAEVFFDDIFIPEAHRIGEEGRGLAIALRSLQRSRTYFAGSSAGLCDRARDLTVAFLRDRVHFGKPLLDQPQIRGQLAQLETDARAMWLIGCMAAAEWESGNPSLLSSCMAKMTSGQVAMRYASAAVELHGAWGCMNEYEVSRIFRDAKFFEIVEGPTFVQQVLIAKELFGNESGGESAARPKKVAA